MQILYVHHAERNRKDKSIDRQMQDLTENGIIEANLLAEKLKQINIKAIYTSSFIRCTHTAEIINQYNHAPIIKEERFNEMKTEETWKEFSLRNMNALDDIIKNNDANDFIICVSSGVNISPFIYYFNNIEPTNDSPKMQAITISPILFSTKNKVF